MDYFEYGDFSGLYDLFQSILALGALLVIIGIAAAVAVYLYAGYVLMCIGRKAGLRKTRGSASFTSRWFGGTPTTGYCGRAPSLPTASAGG